uniref:Autophagy related 2B n=1 Tax=Cyprinus carpio TaxID=7962 RepID=A0A8C1FW01_CYPCA
MPWPFSESIKKRACRYLLHRYLGNFLQEKLSLDQLSLDLYQGTGSLAHVPLDKWSLNEILESVDAPFEVSEGFIQAISLTVPWASLLQENCALEVRGLEMVFRPRPRMASGMEPMCWSSFMTSSMQLAKECLSQRLTDDQGESLQPLEGLEKFAETIETVLRRVKVTFVDTVLRMEHVPENSKTGIALELRINKMLYCDESVEEGSSVNIHQPTTFAHKNLTLEGVYLFWDEFSESARAGLKSSPTQTVSICSAVIKNHLPHPQFPEPVSSSTPFEPVQVGCLSGKLELSMVLKQNEAMPGAKVGTYTVPHSYKYTVALILSFYKGIAQIETLVTISLYLFSLIFIYFYVTLHLIVIVCFPHNHKAFAEVFLDDSRTPAHCHVSMSINAPLLVLVVRFPIPDLRSDQERGPWFKKSLQKELLQLELEDLELKTEFTGGNSSEQTKMELTFKELNERVTAEEEEEEADGHSQEEEEEEEGAAHSLKDVCDFGKPEPSPFSSRRVMYENEEMVIPGDVVEMTEFQEKTMSNSRYILELFFPNVQLALPNKDFYEKLHNRINNDLLLWEPTAPSPVETFLNTQFLLTSCVCWSFVLVSSHNVCEEEESGSEEEILQYYTPAELGYRNRRKKRSKMQPKNSQSLFSIVIKGYIVLCNECQYFQQDDNSASPKKHGEFWMEVKNGTLFGVTQHEGYKDQHYVCFHTSQACLYHHGKQKTVLLFCLLIIHYLLHAFLYFQEFLIAIGMRGVTLEHRVMPSGLGWYDQIVDFLNVSDEPVLGYTPPSSVSTLHLHLWSCSLDYRPLYLPVRSLLTVETFSISSSVSLDHSSSSLRIILDEAALFLSDKINAVSVNLARDYVQVVDMGTLELRITAVKPGQDGKMTEPRFELRCSSDVIHIRTCADSCAALMNLIQYIASYGDLLPPSGLEAKLNDCSNYSVFSFVVCNNNIKITLLTFESALLCLGVNEDHSHDHEPPRSDLFLFPDESGNLGQEPSPTYPVLHSPLISPPAPSLVHDTDDFCILDTPGSRILEKDEEPVVKKLISEPILVREEHFSVPLEGSSSTRGPLHFPVPEIRYLVKEISVVWHLYGGKDFGGGALSSSPARSRGYKFGVGSPSQTPVKQVRRGSRAGGGWGRNPDVLMEIQLSKVRFQHEVYPQAPQTGVLTEQPVSRQVFSVQDLEIQDRLASSKMNKFLYLYSSKEMPRKAHSNMLTVRALHVCPEAGQAPQECCLRVSLMPLRLNIDQDALFFLKDFFTSLAAEVELFSPPDQEGNNQYAKYSETLEFRFTSEVPIRLDYHGKHMAMEQGTFAGIVIGLTQLNCSELKLRCLCYRQGLLGVDKLFSYAINEWLNDIKKNQLPGLLGGVGPIHSLVQLVQGFRDLVWLPIEQYRKDGRIVRGFQRGTASFGTSTAMAALELTNRMVRTIQAAAETAYDMVSPVPDEKECKKIKRYSHYCLAHQPVDLREGVAKAYSVVKEGITDTALTIYDTATREHEQRGMTGAVGGVLRQLPPAVVKPLIVATEATSNVLGGMRNQIHPDARQEESQKWRLGEE